MATVKTVVQQEVQEHVLVTIKKKDADTTASAFSISSASRAGQSSGRRLNFYAFQGHAPELKAGEREVAIFPSREYRPAIVTKERPITSVSAKRVATRAAPERTWDVIVRDKKGTPLADIEVQIFFDQDDDEGAFSKTNAKGVATFKIGRHKKIGTVYVLPLHSHWSRTFNDVDATSAFEVNISTFEEAPTALRHFIRANEGSRLGEGVKIAIVDSGIDRHADLKHALKGGKNLALDGRSYDDNGIHHGTHVAGIIASSKIGIAPKSEIYSYRVFPEGKTKTSTAYIANAIDAAVAAKVDLINLSLGTELHDGAVEMAINDAEAQGIVVIAATGNEAGSVCYPAILANVVAVTAVGNSSLYPNDSSHAGIGERERNQAGDFVSDFSNVGDSVDCTGPGVAVISTVGNKDKYQALDGTSMACPAVTAVAACILSDSPHVFDAPRNKARADALKNLLYLKCKSLNLKKMFQGNGVPQI